MYTKHTYLFFITTTYKSLNFYYYYLQITKTNKHEKKNFTLYGRCPRHGNGGIRSG